MALSEDTLAVADRPPFTRRAARFFARVVLALIVAYAAFAAIHYETKLVGEGRVLDYPVWVALDEGDARVQSTEMRVSARAYESEAPSMSELKRLAGRVAGDRRDAGVDLWSEATSVYRVVYFSGSDPAGGAWIASARYISPLPDEDGQVELTLQRSLYGRYDGVRAGLYAMKNRLQRAADRPLPDVSTQVYVQARPSPQYGEAEAARHFLAALGAERRRVETTNAGTWMWGYAPRLSVVSGAPETLDANVVVHAYNRGQGVWLDIGAPRLGSENLQRSDAR